MISHGVHGNDLESHNWMNKKMNCPYCDIAAKDFHWLKCHLAGTDPTVPSCSKVAIGVKDMYRNELLQSNDDNTSMVDKRMWVSNLSLKRNWPMDSLKPDVTETHGSGTGKLIKREIMENSRVEESVSFSNRSVNPQASSGCSDDSLAKEAKRCIGRFLYENGIDFGAVNSSSFEQMVSLGYGLSKDQIPTCEELRGWILKDALHEMDEYVNGIRNSWGEAGCSILLDGWTDENSRSLSNILVECPKGVVYLRTSDVSDFIQDIDAMQVFLEKILTEVGIENVVQIITYLASPFMKELGERLMKKQRSIFWTVSASACIELILEKLGKFDIIKETLSKTKIITRFIHSNPDVLKLFMDLTGGLGLVRPCKIRSILPFLILENIESEKEKLKTMFLSSDPNYANLTSTKAGERVAELVEDRSFWSGVTTSVKATIPLVRVIELVCGKDRAQIGYIYETFDQVKETIKEEFKSKKSQYAKFWNVIDEVWDEHLHSPLHSAGYFLNPNLFFTEDMHIDPEVCTGLLCCLVRATQDVHVQDLMTIQLEQYRQGKGVFGVGCKVKECSGPFPANWWSKYGRECPELQRLAIRILSQTCEGASKFQLNRSVAEGFLTKGRNQMEQDSSSDMVFLHYNLQLQNFAVGKNDYFRPNNVDLMNDWIVDKA